MTNVVGNRIGKGPTGVALPNDGNGVRLEDNSTSNAIGGTSTDTDEENLISKSGEAAIVVDGSGSANNFIGLNRGSGNGGLFIDRDG